MNLPRVLKEMNVFGDGESFQGECQTFTRPKLTMKLEEYRGGGMPGAVDLQMGLEKLECTHKYGGDMPALNKGFAAGRIDASQLRFAGGYQNDATGAYDDVQIIVRGRHTEIDRGDDEVGAKGGTTYKTSCVYYKETLNGVVQFEIDMLNGVLIVDGVDQWAALRAITR